MCTKELRRAIIVLSVALLAPAALAHEPKAIAVTIYYSKDGQSDATFFKISKIFSDINECVSHIRSSANSLALALNSGSPHDSTITHANFQCHYQTGWDWAVRESVQVANFDGQWELADLDRLLRKR